MRKKITTLAVTVLLLSGCGDTNEPAAEAEPTTEPATVETTSEAAEGPNLDDDVIEVGEEFRVNSFDADNNIYHWDVKVTNAETVDVLKNADDNPDYDGGNSEYVDAKPAEGNEFLHVEYEMTNSSGVPAYLQLQTQIEFSDGEIFAPLADDLDYYTPNLTSQRETPAGETQNNNTTSQGDWVIEMPKGSEVSALLITEYSAYAGDEYRVELK